MHNMLIYGLLCIKCVKNTKGAIFQLLKNFGQSPTRAGALLAHGQTHDRVLGCVCATKCLEHAFFKL